MSTRKKWKSHQAFVDEIVHHCLATGIRDRDSIIAQIELERIDENNWAHAEGHESGVEDLNRDHKALAHKISLTTSRRDVNGYRDIWCVPGQYRFVSIRRMKELIGAGDSGGITAEEFAELEQSKADLLAVAEHEIEDGRKKLASGYVLREVVANAECTVLDLKDAVREMVS